MSIKIDNLLNQKNPLNQMESTDQINPLKPLNQIESIDQSFYNEIHKVFNEKINNQDFTQRYHMSINIILELYRVITSSLLILFVPQLCDNHTCSIEERLLWSEMEELYNIAQTAKLCVEHNGS